VTTSDPVLLPGFFGKVPTRGDFVSSRLPRSFLELWDDWLQDGMVASRQQLGEGWVETYLSCPVWCFALTAGLCGEHAVAGLLMTSVDAVGRHFPFTLAALLPAASNVALLPETADGWFTAAMSVAAVVRREAFDFDSLDKRVKALGPLPASGTGAAGAMSPASVWWMTGEADPIRIAWPGMPPEDAFVVLLRAGRGQQELCRDTAVGTPAPGAWAPGTWEVP
jgi:type VI secretion system protein ImpM